MHPDADAEKLVEVLTNCDDTSTAEKTATNITHLR